MRASDKSNKWKRVTGGERSILDEIQRIELVLGAQAREQFPADHSTSLSGIAAHRAQLHDALLCEKRRKILKRAELELLREVQDPTSPIFAEEVHAVQYGLNVWKLVESRIRQLLAWEFDNDDRYGRVGSNVFTRSAKEYSLDDSTLRIARSIFCDLQSSPAMGNTTQIVDRDGENADIQDIINDKLADTFRKRVATVERALQGSERQGTVHFQACVREPEVDTRIEKEAMARIIDKYRYMRATLREMLRKLISSDEFMRECRTALHNPEISNMVSGFQHHLQRMAILRENFSNVYQSLSDVDSVGWEEATQAVVNTISKKDRFLKLLRTIADGTHEAKFQKSLPQIGKTNTIFMAYTVSYLRKELERVKKEDHDCLLNIPLERVLKVQEISDYRDPSYSDAVIEILSNQSGYTLNQQLVVYSTKQLARAVQQLSYKDRYIEDKIARYRVDNIHLEFPNFIVAQSLEYPRRRIVCQQIAHEALAVYKDWRKRKDAQVLLLEKFGAHLCPISKRAFRSLKHTQKALICKYIESKVNIYGVTLRFMHDQLKRTVREVSILQMRYQRALKFFREGNITRTRREMRPFRNSLPMLVYQSLAEGVQIVASRNTVGGNSITMRFVSDEEYQEVRKYELADPFNIDEHGRAPQSIFMKSGLHVHLACQHALDSSSECKFLSMAEHELVEYVVEQMGNRDLLSIVTNDHMSLSQSPLSSSSTSTSTPDHRHHEDWLEVCDMVNRYVRFRYPVHGLHDIDNTEETTQRKRRQSLRAKLYQAMLERYSLTLKERSKRYLELFRKGLDLDTESYGVSNHFFAFIESTCTPVDLPGAVHYWTSDDGLHNWIDRVDGIRSSLELKSLHPLNIQIINRYEQWNRANLEKGDSATLDILNEKLRFAKNCRAVILQSRRLAVERTMIEDLYTVWRPAGAVWCERMAVPAAIMSERRNFLTSHFAKWHTELFHGVVRRGLTVMREMLLEPIYCNDEKRCRVISQLQATMEEDMSDRILSLYTHLMPPPVIQTVLFVLDAADNKHDDLLQKIGDLLDDQLHFMEAVEKIWTRIQYLLRNESEHTAHDPADNVLPAPDPVTGNATSLNLGPGQAAINRIIESSAQEHMYLPEAMEFVLRREFSHIFDANIRHLSPALQELQKQIVDQVIFQMEHKDPTFQFLDHLIAITEQQIEIYTSDT